jgi:hypothetical protein
MGIMLIVMGSKWVSVCLASAQNDTQFLVSAVPMSARTSSCCFLGLIVFQLYHEEGGLHVVLHLVSTSHPGSL